MIRPLAARRRPSPGPPPPGRQPAGKGRI